MSTVITPTYNADDLFCYSCCPKRFQLSKTSGYSEVYDISLVELKFHREILRLAVEQSRDPERFKDKAKFSLHLRKLYAKYFHSVTPNGLQFLDELKIACVISSYRAVLDRFKDHNFSMESKVIIPYHKGDDLLCYLEFNPIVCFTKQRHNAEVNFLFVADSNEWNMCDLGRRYEHVLAQLGLHVVGSKVVANTYYVNPVNMELAKVEANWNHESMRLAHTLTSIKDRHFYKAYLGGMCASCPHVPTCKPFDQIKIQERLSSPIVIH